MMCENRFFRKIVLVATIVAWVPLWSFGLPCVRFDCVQTGCMVYPDVNCDPCDEWGTPTCSDVMSIDFNPSNSIIYTLVPGNTLRAITSSEVICAKYQQCGE
jgi:hypothetical protein